MTSVLVIFQPQEFIITIITRLQTNIPSSWIRSWGTT